RIRVAAALALGKSKSPGARPALEKALGDAHPAVRSAAAAALGTLGDARAIPALKTALGTESDAGVKAEMERVVQSLGTAPARPRRCGPRRRPSPSTWGRWASWRTSRGWPP